MIYLYRPSQISSGYSYDIFANGQRIGTLYDEVIFHMSLSLDDLLLSVAPVALANLNRNQTWKA